MAHVLCKYSNLFDMLLQTKLIKLLNEMKSIQFKLKFLNANRYNIFFLALLYSQFTPCVLNKQSIADFICFNTQINCVRKLINETDFLNTYEHVRIQNTCLHPCNDHVLFHLTVFSFVCIAQYHDFFPLSQIWLLVWP